MRQRRPLRVERYHWLRSGGLLNLGYDLARGLEISIGAGVESQVLFGINQVEPLGAIPVQQERKRLRALWALNSELSFDPDILRLDRQHELDLEVRQYFTSRSVWRLAAHYQKIFELGWHDLVLETGGVALFGGYIFPQEEPVSNFVRGVFGETFYSGRVGGLSMEFRFSISRDVLKIAAYTDLAVFEDRGIFGTARRARVATGCGLGFNALLLDVIQFDLYYGIGFATVGTSGRIIDHGPSARLSKAF
jgi:hypothetical protein